MSSAASTSALRQLFESHASQVTAAVESLVAEARDCGRREFADQLNQAVRRIRQSAAVDELAATLADTAAAFSSGTAWFRVEGERIRCGGIRPGGGEPPGDFGELEVALESAAAFAGAVESRDPVMAAATPSEISEPLAALVARSGEVRVSIHPVVLRERVPALLCAWGGGQDSAVELLTQVAAGVWAEIDRPPAPQLVQIAAPPEPPPAGPEPLPAEPEPQPRPAWEQLPAEEQRIHLRAQRYARVHVAEMRLREAVAVQSGRAQRDLYGALRTPIDSAREEYRQSFFVPCPSMVDYFHLELVRTLAHDDPELLGKDYPGPMV